jgi:ABC-type oligopeptide transport system ATPase subunit
MGTFSKFLSVWGEGNYKRTGNLYRGHNPFVTGSDGNAFTVTFEDEEHAPWYDHKNNVGGSLYQACERLNIDIERTNGNGQHNTPKGYAGLVDYAERHLHIPADVLLKWEWRETMHYCVKRGKEAPALEYPTKGGKRYRMLDGDKPKYLSAKGYKPCWYGLKFALDILKDLPELALIICNGEPSTIVAQYYGIPAICAPGGERTLSDGLIQQLKQAWQGDIWIVFDCDDKGRTAGKLLQEQLRGAGYVATALDIGLHENADLADLCHLHGVGTYEHLSTLLPDEIATSGVISGADAAKFAIANIYLASEGEHLVMPFKKLHRLGGNCHYIAPGEVIIISGISGGGKTTFAECLTEPLIQMGRRVLWDGKEWSPDKMHARRIQRETGITTEQQKAWRHYKKEKMMGIRDEYCEGKPLSDAELAAYLKASDEIARYAGRMDYMPFAPCIEDTLGLMSEKLVYYRARREPPVCVVLDYAQLWKMQATGNAPSNLFEYALDYVKDWTLREKIITLTLSQSNKDATDKVKVADSEYLLTSADAQYIRDDKSNLMITINPQYEEDRNHMHNGRPQLRKRDYIVLNVVKNSDGQEGFVRLVTQWDRLLIEDKTPRIKKEIGD